VANRESPGGAAVKTRVLVVMTLAGPAVLGEAFAAVRISRWWARPATAKLRSNWPNDCDPTSSAWTCSARDGRAGGDRADHAWTAPPTPRWHRGGGRSRKRSGGGHARTGSGARHRCFRRARRAPAWLVGELAGGTADLATALAVRVPPAQNGRRPSRPTCCPCFP